MSETCLIKSCDQPADRGHYCFNHWDWVFNELGQDKYRTESCPPSEGWKAPERAENQIPLFEVARRPEVDGWFAPPALMGRAS